MVTYPLPRLDDLCDARRARRTLTRTLYDRAVREIVFTDDRLPARLERTIRAAKREEYLYEHYLGEPMPAHLRAGLFLEVRLWISAYDQITNVPPEEEQVVAAARLRPTLSDLLDVITLEEEMLTNPLVRHYEARLAELERTARFLP